MDFFTTHDAPIAITIDGVPYTVPLLRNPSLKKWAALLRKQYADEATAHLVDAKGRLDAEKKARFLIISPAPAVDIADLMVEATTPDGAEIVVDAQLEAAGVPADVRKRFVSKVHPDQMRDFAQMLARRDETLAKLGVDPKEARKDPLTQPPGESGGSPETGAQSAPDSQPSTAA